MVYFITISHSGNYGVYIIIAFLFSESVKIFINNIKNEAVTNPLSCSLKMGEFLNHGRK